MRPTRAPSLAGDVALLLCAIIWGTTFLLTKKAMVSASPAAFNGARFGVATIALLPVLLRVRWSEFRRALGFGALLGALLALGFWLQTWGLARVSPSRSAFVTTFYVFFTPLIEWFITRRLPQRPVIAGGFVALLGVGLMTGAGWGEPLNPGDLATLACAFVFSVQMVALAEALRRRSSPALLFLEIAVCGLVTAPAAFVLDHPPRLPMSATTVMVVLYLALIATVLVFGLQNFGQTRTSATRAGVLFSSEPVWAAVFSALFFGERLSAREIAGAGLVLAGLLIATLLQQRPASVSGATSPT